MHGYVYILRCNSTGLYKLGKTRNIHHRLQDLQRLDGSTIVPQGYTGSTVEFLFRYDTHNLHNGVEKTLHRLFNPFRETGEWFRLSKTMLDAAVQYCSHVERNKTYARPTNARPSLAHVLPATTHQEVVHQQTKETVPTWQLRSYLLKS